MPRLPEKFPDERLADAIRLRLPVAVKTRLNRLATQLNIAPARLAREAMTTGLECLEAANTAQEEPKPAA